ncbi:MAG TPA: MlaD family protein [Chitinophagaceae bacterium]|nr:MlaD family protein [Chitinophagaceae bacterium]
MKTTKGSRAVIVGLFVFLGLAIFIVAVLTLGGQQKTFEKAFMVKAIFDDVQGLQKGNNVWFSGVKIGTIKKISFYRSSQVEVDINIEEKAKEYIRKDAKAKISSDGLIGNKIIVIYGGTQQSPEVESGDMLGVEKAVGSDEIMTTLQTNNRNLLDITTDMKVLTKRLTAGEGTVGKLLTDDALANDLQAVMLTLRKAAANTERLTATATLYAAQLNKKGTLANELVSDTVLYARLKATATQIEDVSKTANGVVGDLKNVSAQVNAGLNDKTSPAGMLLKDEAVAADIKAMLRNLNAGSRKLDQDLEALQHNFLLRGFFKKKKGEPKDTIIITN